MKGSDDQHSKCTEVEMLQAERSECFWIRWPHLDSWVAQNIMRTSLLKSLHKNTPKTYMTCLSLNLQGQLQIQLKLRGLSAKLHLMNFEKVQMNKSSSPCKYLCKTTPLSYMAWANLKFEQTLPNQEFAGEAFCKLTMLPNHRGSNAKMLPTMLTSSSSYPELI